MFFNPTSDQDTKPIEEEPKPPPKAPDDQNTKTEQTVSSTSSSANKDLVLKPTKSEAEHITTHHKAPGTKSKKVYSPSGSLSDSRKHSSKSMGGRVGGKSYAAIVSNKEEGRSQHSEHAGTSSGGFVQQLPTEFDEEG